MTTIRSGSQSDTLIKTSNRLKHPKQYKVILLNDDYTSMEFVVEVLEGIFMKSPSEAVQIMLQVHHQGRGICGIFTKQIAEAKADLVNIRAQEEGFPLRCAVEEV